MATPCRRAWRSCSAGSSGVGLAAISSARSEQSDAVGHLAHGARTPALTGGIARPRPESTRAAVASTVSFAQPRPIRTPTIMTMAMMMPVTPATWPNPPSARSRPRCAPDPVALVMASPLPADDRRPPRAYATVASFNELGARRWRRSPSSLPGPRGDGAARPPRRTDFSGPGHLIFIIILGRLQRGPDPRDEGRLDRGDLPDPVPGLPGAWSPPADQDMPPLPRHGGRDRRRCRRGAPSPAAPMMGRVAAAVQRGPRGRAARRTPALVGRCSARDPAAPAGPDPSP